MLTFVRELAQIALSGAGDNPAVRALIAETAPYQCSLPMSAWFRMFALIVEEGGPDRYETALWMRSELEFWREFYRDAAPVALELLDSSISEIDETLAEQAPNRYVSKIPDGIPASHVWWHRHASDPR